jgi:hypothetical protein
MDDTRKEQERAELHRVIWGIANDLRGSVDGWDFKQYVLGMLFYRYISETYPVISTRMNMQQAIRHLTTPSCLMQKLKLPVRTW